MTNPSTILHGDYKVKALIQDIKYDNWKLGNYIYKWNTLQQKTFRKDRERLPLLDAKSKEEWVCSYKCMVRYSKVRDYITLRIKKNEIKIEQNKLRLKDIKLEVLAEYDL